jgi:iron complex outermembrane receptor protein
MQTTTAHRFRRPLLACVIIGLSVSGAGLAQTAPQAAAGSTDQTIQLPKFDVNGNPVDPYNAAEATSAGRIAAATLETPMSVYSITPQMIRDLNPPSMWEVAQYYPGISPGRSTGVANFQDRMVYRGFEAIGRTTDNFSGLMVPGMGGGMQLNPIFIDHAELVLGPDSITAPTATAGGTICAITKSPQFTPSIVVSGDIGNYNANRVTVDATGPIGDGKHWAYRFLAAYQDTSSFMPGTFINFDVGAGLTYKISDTAKVTLKYIGQQGRYGGTTGMSVNNGVGFYDASTLNGATVSTSPNAGYSYSGWNGDATWSERILRMNMTEAEFTTALGEHVNMRLAGMADFEVWNVFEAYPSPSIVETWDTVTGQENSVAPFNVTAMPEFGFIQHTVNRQLQLQNDYVGQFTVGDVTLQPSAGFAYQNGDTPVQINPQDRTLGTSNLYAGYYDPPVPDKSAFTTVGFNWPQKGDIFQTYAYLRAGFLHDRILLTGGTSRVWANVNDYSKPFINQDGFLAGNQAGAVTLATFSHTNIPLQPTVQPWHNTYQAGLLGKVLPNVALYYNFSTNAAIATNAPIWQAGTQHEFGVKANFLDNRLTLTAAHFQLTEANVSSTNPLFYTGQSTVQSLYANLANHGEEFSAIGGLTKNLSVVASLSLQKLRDPWGRKQRNIPDQLANLLLDYRFTTGVLSNLNVFAGAVHEGKVAGETITGFTTLGVPELPGYYLPDFTVFNAGAGYTWRNLRYNLNVNNVFDTHAWWQGSSRASTAPYPGINVTFSVTAHVF